MSQPIIKPKVKPAGTKRRKELCIICGDECDENRGDYSPDLWMELRDIALKWKDLDRHGQLYDTVPWNDGPNGVFFHKVCKMELASDRKLNQAKLRKQKLQQRTSSFMSLSATTT